jgi:tetratricopeptide (TPR) repeat protein
LRYATLPLLSGDFPELDEDALLDLEAEDYAAVLKIDPSDEDALQLKIGLDINRGDLAAASHGLQNLQAAYPEAWWLASHEERVARLAALKRDEVLPGSEKALPSASPSPSVEPGSPSYTLARGYLKIAMAHADENDMPRAEQAATSALIMDPSWVFAYDCRARYLHMQGKSAAALTDLEHALTLEPENTGILFGLCDCLLQVGPTPSLPGDAGSWTQYR